MAFIYHTCLELVNMIEMLLKCNVYFLFIRYLYVQYNKLIYFFSFVRFYTKTSKIDFGFQETLKLKIFD